MPTWLTIVLAVQHGLTTSTAETKRTAGNVNNDKARNKLNAAAAQQDTESVRAMSEATNGKKGIATTIMAKSKGKGKGRGKRKGKASPADAMRKCIKKIDYTLRSGIRDHPER